MLPVIALVGRPNVGKSTLFNSLTGTRDAIVADVPGVTRDRQYGFGRLGPVPYVAIDTGGLVENPTGIETQMRVQTERAVQEADRLVLIVDARSGITSQDEFVARELRRSGKPVFIAVNKAEGLDYAIAGADFQSLALGEPIAISAAHGTDLDELMSRVLDGFVGEETPTDESGVIRVAIIGRPNVGKSTLVNRLIGDERVIASDQPGTTRDRIFVPFERDGREFVLIDTAGVRRRSKVEDVIERVSVAKTLQAIEEAHVVILVVDAHDSIAEQDASVLGLALKRGRALLIAVNKWDGIPEDQRETIKRQLALKLDFVAYAPLHFISARHGTGVGEMALSAIRAYDSAMREMRTPELNRALEGALTAHQPPLVRGRRIKLRYAHQGGKNPPRIVVHGNQTNAVPDSYTRYLANVFRKVFDLYATPVALDFRTDGNPFDRERERRAAGKVRPKTTTHRNMSGKRDQRSLQKKKAGKTGKAGTRGKPAPRRPSR